MGRRTTGARTTGPPGPPRPPPPRARAPVPPRLGLPTRPSAVTRPAFLAAAERPFLRSQSTAASRSPPVSPSAFLQSIIPAPVLSRRSFTMLAVMFAMSCSVGCQAAGGAADSISSADRRSGSASASRLTMMGGNAIRGAAREALQRWGNEDRPAVGVFTYHAPSTTNYDPETGNSIPHVVFSPIAEAVEVLVDTETGSICVPRVISVLDVGQTIHPAMLTGQVEGAVVQALGYSLLENFITDRGRIQTPDLTTYLVPTVLDVPDRVESHIVEHPDPTGPWGARGAGETPFIAVAPALVGAVHDAIGFFFDHLPLIPQAIVSGMRVQQSGSCKSP